MALPEPEGEDALVADWSARDDLDGLAELIEEAVVGRRLTLAARLVGLLPDDHGDDRPALERARTAARLVLHRRLEPHHVSWSELEDAWHALHRRWVQRIKLAQRQRLEGRTERVGRLDRGRDRRR